MYYPTCHASWFAILGGGANAMDKREAQAQGLGISVTSPDGKVPLDEGWNIVTPEWFYTSSDDEALYFKAGGSTYNFSKVVNQIAVANCISAGRGLYLQVSNGYISAAGCLPTSGGGGGTAFSENWESGGIDSGKWTTSGVISVASSSSLGGPDSWGQYALQTSGVCGSSGTVMNTQKLSISRGATVSFDLISSGSSCGF